MVGAGLSGLAEAHWEPWGTVEQGAGDVFIAILPNTCPHCIDQKTAAQRRQTTPHS